MKARSLEQELESIRNDLNSGDFPAALTGLKRVMSIAPFARGAQFLLGDYFWRRGQLGRARTAMKWAAASVPDEPEAWENLALLGSMRGELVRSAIEYRRAVINGANAWGLLAKFPTSRQRREMKAVLCLDPKDADATCALALGEAGMLEGEHIPRCLAHAEIIAAAAGSMDLLGRVAVAEARLFQASGRYARARAPLRRAILLDPSKPGRIFDFGRSEFEVGRSDAAGRQVTRSLLIQPIEAGFARQEPRPVVSRHPTEIADRLGYQCFELADAFSVKIDPVGQPAPRIHYRVPATFLARADGALLLSGHNSVILQDDTVLMEGLTYRLKRRRWDGPCYAYISENNGILASLPVPETRIDGEAVLLGGGGNYYHNIVDWLSRLPTILDTPGLAELPVLVTDDMPASVIEILEMLGLERRRLRLLAPGLYPVERLWIPSLAHGRLGCVSPRYLEFLEERLFSRFRDPRTRGGRRLYFARRDDRHRRIVNADELNMALERHGFETVGLEHLSAADQFALAAEADVVVAPFGAGLTNILACPISCKVIELTHHQAVRPLFPILAGLRGQAFHRITGQPAGLATAGLPMHDDFEIPVAALEPLLE
jgi:Flp pilus assembly protein TadD